MLLRTAAGYAKFLYLPLRGDLKISFILLPLPVISHNLLRSARENEEPTAFGVIGVKVTISSWKYMACGVETRGISV